MDVTESKIKILNSILDVTLKLLINPTDVVMKEMKIHSKTVYN